MKTLFLLLIIYQFKHFLADYPLQGKFMLGKFKPGFGFVLPLLAHVAVHGAFTFVISFLFLLYRAGNGEPIYRGIALLSLFFALFDMACHFTMDRIKASPGMLGRFKPLSGAEYMNLAQGIDPYSHVPVTMNDTNKYLKSNTYFWWCLGLDQMVHHLTHYAIICMLLS